MSAKAAALVVILAIIAGFFITLERKGQVRESLEEEYDYVIVGAGSAGSVLANRLSEDDDVTVAILEAGGEEKYPDHYYPCEIWRLPLSQYDWQYRIEPQEHACLGMVDRRCRWPRGKALGGSSSINSMVYSRGSRHDYDSWAANGCEGWSYADVLPYFRKMETNHNEKMVKSGYHGSDGPLHVTDVHHSPTMFKAWMEAGEELGMSTEDVHGAQELGLGPGQVTVDARGIRSSTSTAYLRPAMKRDNLHVATGAHATKIMFDGKTATGVSYLRNGSLHTVRARTEVILAGGAINSPQLLLLSGIGSRRHLDEQQIPVVADLPVGENLQDHLFVDTPSYQVTNGDGMTKERVSGWLTWLQYMLFGKGFMAGHGLRGVGFVRSKLQGADKLYPDIAYEYFAGLIGIDQDTHGMIKEQLGLSDEYFGSIMAKKANLEGFEMLPHLLHPRSVGYVRLRSTDPLEHPIINPNYLQHEDDVRVLIEGIRIAQKIGNTTAFQKLNARQLDNQLSACKHHLYDSDAYWSCYIRHIALPSHHPVGTCKMGAVGDPTVVVDPTLRVKGVTNLRVVDASVMPQVPSGNTNVPTIMVAERAADLIKDHHR